MPRSPKSVTLSGKKPYGRSLSVLADKRLDVRETDMPEATQAGARLKQLRERAGLSQAECGKAIGKGATGYARYENEPPYHYDHEPDRETSPVPAAIVLKLISIMVPGNGEKPVLLDELLDISELKGARQLLLNGSAEPVPGALLEATSYIGANNLMVRHRLELGTFRDSTRYKTKDYGLAPILPLHAFPQDRQWAAVVNDDHGLPLGLPAGTYLHCVDTDAVPVKCVVAGAVVVASVPHERLTELCLGVVSEFTLRGVKLRSTSGKPMVGDVLGVCLYKYGPMLQQT